MQYRINVMTFYSMRSIPPVFIIVCLTLLSGCSFDSVAKRIDPYRIDLRQGNYLDQEMVSQLRKGMTREQVQFVLGRPLLADAFHSNRWDYVYYFQPGSKGGNAEKRIFSVFFDEEGLLDYVEGDVTAGEEYAEVLERSVKQKQLIEIHGPVPKKKK